MRAFFVTAILFVAAIASIHVVSHSYVALQNRVLYWGSFQYRHSVAYLARTIGYAPALPPIERVDDLESIVALESAVNALSEALVWATIDQESRNDAIAVSHKGACGLMQLMPATLAACGMKRHECYDPRKNIQCGTWWMSLALKANGGYLEEALEEYNGGRKCVGSKCRESIDYAKKILARLARPTKKASLK